LKYTKISQNISFHVFPDVKNIFTYRIGLCITRAHFRIVFEYTVINYRLDLILYKNTYTNILLFNLIQFFMNLLESLLDSNRFDSRNLSIKY
jgi:hypothetical protein